MDRIELLVFFEKFIICTQVPEVHVFQALFFFTDEYNNMYLQRSSLNALALINFVWNCKISSSIILIRKILSCETSSLTN